MTRDWCAIALLMLSLLAGWSDPAGAQLEGQTIRIGIGAPLTGGAAGFGIRVSLAGDGRTALIGGWNDDRGVGAAWVFRRSGSTWTA